MIGDFYVFSSPRDSDRPWVVAFENEDATGFTELRFSQVYITGVAAKTANEYHVLAHRQRYKLLIENAELRVVGSEAFIMTPSSTLALDPDRPSGAV